MYECPTRHANPKNIQPQGYTVTGFAHEIDTCDHSKNLYNSQFDTY